uniref:DUF243 domain-containing protein n=1 Tax=Musca domestica TaxID=7370 RepID=A0A1I8M9K9_MUSDO
MTTKAPTVPSKPEVFFIKYKTEEEAQHAQRQIQAEYDKIEGSSEHTHTGVAPQQSVVGILDGGNAGGASTSIGSSSVGSGSSGTLCSLVAVGLAKPQYNYGNGVSGSFGNSGAGFSAGSSLGGSSFGSGSGLIGGGASFGSGSSLVGGSSSFGGGPAFGAGQSFGGSLGGAPSFGGSSFGAQHGNNYQQGYSGGHAAAEAPLVHKQFITVSAPEDSDSLSKTKHLVIGRPQKNYRVVFIKAPSASSSNVKLSAEFAPKEEKTVIYVLAKNDNALEVNDIATPAPTVPSKPEVFFIKYKTEEEAQHAQRQIQAEYDKIEGSSEHTDAGVAPQQSVVGILDGGNVGGAATSIGGSSVGSGSSGISSGSFGSGSSGSFTGNSDSVAVKSAAYLPPTTTH